MKAAFFLLCLVAYAAADLYMHNPRGSNCRLNEANTNRNNGNRLFDTQNNAKGGYCWGPAMSYYEGSLLTIEWTNQHGCGNPKLECNIVIQYMCGSKVAPGPELIRDGATTDRIPTNPDTYLDTNANGDYLYGMHETLAHYQACNARNRNKGLFVADRELRGNLNGNQATRTRQNNNGNRNGLECPEERDYYPYWHPSPWKDIAVLVGNEVSCDLFKSESQNVKEKYHCLVKDTQTAAPENYADACTGAGNDWVAVPAHGISAPDCVLAPWSRDNHLGNGFDGFANTYNWTLPRSDDEPCIKGDDCNCVLRMRYNISTTDLDGWGFDDYTKNAINSPVRQDPYREVAPGSNVSIALDTTQFGRTFQDRSHIFHIRPRDGVNGMARIFNLNVRGKRGNIVETYPSVEYDFVPSYLETRVGDYIHFQWTGCDTNPANNAGEGTAATDRNNIVQIANLGASLPVTQEWLDKNNALFEDEELRRTMALLGQTNCKTLEQLRADNNDNNNDIETDTGNCFKLNAASQYFDGGLVKMNRTGVFHYMSSRNNNFTNRGQKGTITVASLLPAWAIGIAVAGAAVFAGAAVLTGAVFYARTHPGSGLGSKLSSDAFQSKTLFTLNN